ncbi:hypothetical protein BBK82_08730 [Lentzea guizhouensis]|uniref:Ricin B lectin domain-containing protein n=1 Tax=Lentzea guizhouensis TaxID=1586287 RepID=A0A1B2HEI6_9PSEU|nr:RICIN domain-containing protein [Lentzea guizhouensis]ANZ36138.1 hypothetical protein BBK82_08730 [Lentzea guizhouensis]
MGKKIFAIAATAAAVTTLYSAPAHAEPIVQYQLSGTTRCLADTGLDIVLRTCGELTPNQRWIVPVSDSDWPHNNATGKCLGATTAGDVVGQACSTSATQRWRRVAATGTSFQFRNLATGKCLTAQVTLAACATGSARWVGLR